MKLRAAAIPLILAGSVQAYEYQQEACYRRLGDGMRADNTFTFQTPYLCMRRCGNLGLNYAALRGVECFCGSEKPLEKYEIPLEHCDTPCAGWEKEICGGYKAWSLYNLNSDLDLASSTTAPSSTKITSSSTSGTQSTAESESDAVTTSSAGMSNSTSISLSPAESTKIMFSASSQAASTASTTPSSYSPSVLGSGSHQLELILQWNNDTHRCFTRNEETRHIWRDLIIEEAFNTPFLMHGILAVSALQFSLSKAEHQRAFWLGIAAAHKGQALPPFLANFSDINAANAKAMLGFASLVVAFAFGSALTGRSDPEKPSLDALNDAFILCRGVQEITSTASPFLRESNFAPLFDLSRPVVNIPSSTIEALDRLASMNTTSWLGEQHDTATYARVIQALRDLLPYTYLEPTSMTLAAGWAIRSPPAYLENLQNREPFALVIHAHYCAFLHIARENCFIQFWGSAVLRDIWHILDSDWKQHVDWPINEVFGPGHIL